MIKIKAYISLYKNSRDTPFFSGYRPLFVFQEGVYTSGSIELQDRDIFHPGESGIVNILFVERKFLGHNFDIGAKFIFCESPRSNMGEGTVEDILYE